MDKLLSKIADELVEDAFVDGDLKINCQLVVNRFATQLSLKGVVFTIDIISNHGERLFHIKYDGIQMRYRTGSEEKIVTNTWAIRYGNIPNNSTPILVYKGQHINLMAYVERAKSKLITDVIRIPFSARYNSGDELRVSIDPHHNFVLFVKFGKGAFTTVGDKEVEIPAGKTVIRKVKSKLAAQQWLIRMMTFLKLPLRFSPQMIGQGTYGCVFYPAISCTEGCTPPRCANAVAKLMSREDAEEEAREMTVIDRIDRDGQFHWKLIKMCTPSPKSLRYLDQCFVGGLTKDNATILLYPFGGKSFDNIKKFGILELIAFINVFKGLQLFYTHGFVHNDIKMSNMVFTGGTSHKEPVVLKFIDFGLSMQISHTIEWPYNTDNHVWPPQVMLINDDYNDDTIRKYCMAQQGSCVKDSIKRLLRSEKSLMRRRLLTKKQIMQKQDMFGVGRILRYLIDNDMISNTLKNNASFMDAFTMFANKCSSYSWQERPIPLDALETYKEIVKMAAPVLPHISGKKYRSMITGRHFNNRKTLSIASRDGAGGAAAAGGAGGAAAAGGAGGAQHEDTGSRREETDRPSRRLAT